MKTTTKYKIEKTSSLNFLLTIIICSSLFGLAMFKAGVFLVPVMREQFIFRCNIMLKMFLSAASFSTLSFTLMHMFGYNKNLNVVEKKYYETNKVGLPAVVVSTSLLGMGMEIGGACPGTLFIQIGSGNVPNGFYTVLGAIIGANIFLSLNTTLKTFQSWLGKWSSKKKHRLTLYTWLNINRITAGIIMSILLMGIAIVVDILSPGSGNSILPRHIEKNLWHPIGCGAIIGCMQIPLMLSHGKHLGTSYVNSIPLNRKKISLSNTSSLIYTLRSTDLVTRQLPNC